MGNKNKEQLDSFVKYCEYHPELRFFQALRNWSGNAFILAQGDDDAMKDNLRDTYFFDGWQGIHRIKDDDYKEN